MTLWLVLGGVVAVLLGLVGLIELRDRILFQGVEFGERRGRLLQKIEDLEAETATLKGLSVHPSQEGPEQ